jgi:hypothetical protein
MTIDIYLHNTKLDVTNLISFFKKAKKLYATMHHSSSNKTLKFYYAPEWAEACPIIHFIHELLVLV